MSKPCIVGINNANGIVEFASKTVNKRERVEAARQNLDVVVVSGDIARKGLDSGLPTYEQLLIESEITKKVMVWMSNGRTGLSSTFLAINLLNGKAISTANNNYPHDPSDLERCLRLIHEVPALRQKLPIMKDISKEWNALVENWSLLESTFKDETGFPNRTHSSAPKTYALMQSIYKG